jgi:hypothetical protein
MSNDRGSAPGGFFSNYKTVLIGMVSLLTIILATLAAHNTEEQETNSFQGKIDHHTWQRP